MIDNQYRIALFGIAHLLKTCYNANVVIKKYNRPRIVKMA